MTIVSGGPPIPDDEPQRIAQLVACDLLDTPPEISFDEIVELARMICQTPIAFVSLIDADRQWFKARVGFSVVQTSRRDSFCAHAITSQEALVIPDTREDERFKDNPFVTGSPHIRFYAGVPIRIGEGSAIGTLCVLDMVPREMSDAQLASLATLARRVEIEIVLRRDARRWGGEPTTNAASTGPLPRGGEASPSPTSLDEGAMIADRYRVERLIGAGGMGRVYRALDTKSDTAVAVKVLGKLLVSEVEGVERFAREAEALARVDDDHVTRLLDVGNLSDGAPFIAMELVEGTNLAERDERRLAIPDAVAIVSDACDAITRAHEAGVIHRDLKPSNIFVVRKEGAPPKVKLLDFGIAKLVTPSPSSPPNVTGESTVLGSPAYMSPEQLLSSRDVDASTDVWALGVILYELLTDAYPFEGETTMAICARVFGGSPVMLRARRPDVPEALETVVMKCFAREKSERWSSARALASALAPFRV